MFVKGESVKVLAVHRSGDHNLMIPVTRHFQVAEQRSIHDRVFAESAADILNSILQPLTAIKFILIHKEAALPWGRFRLKLDCPHCDRPDRYRPSVILLKGTECCLRNFIRELRHKRKPALILSIVKGCVTDAELNRSDIELMEPQFVSYVLRQLQK